MTKNFFAPLLICIFCLTSCISQENPPEIKTPDQSKYTTETVVDGIEIPWGMDFINENEMLNEKKGFFTEFLMEKKQGSPDYLKFIKEDKGLMDVALHQILIGTKPSISIRVHLEGEKGGNTALYCAKLNENSLSNLKLLYKGQPNTKKRHWGHKNCFDDKGHLYFGIGDRGNRDVNPQNLNRDGGKIYRLNLDGVFQKTIHLSKRALKAVYSYGHRNPQGMTIHPKTGEIWENEHGPKGGDEINIVKKEKLFGGYHLWYQL